MPVVGLGVADQEKDVPVTFEDKLTRVVLLPVQIV